MHHNYYDSQSGRVNRCNRIMKAVLQDIRNSLAEESDRALFDSRDGRILNDVDEHRFFEFPPIYSKISMVMLVNIPASAEYFWEYYKELDRILDDVPSFYEHKIIKKNNGKNRHLFKVKGELKRYQCLLKDCIFDKIAAKCVSDVSHAYVKRKSFVTNAEEHLNAPMLLKMDIKHFFDSITREHIYKILDRYTPQYNNTVRKMIVDLTTVKNHLVQGACTSPSIANIVLADFDRRVMEYCEVRGIIYTRYSDDLTFSGSDFDAQSLKEFVRQELLREGFVLNYGKTQVLGVGQRHKVTGLICNDNCVRVPSEYKKGLRQEIYYIKKFGVSEHIRRTRPKGYTLYFSEKGNKHELQYLYNLLARVNYVLSIEVNNREMVQYRYDLKTIITDYEEYQELEIRDYEQRLNSIIVEHQVSSIPNLRINLDSKRGFFGVYFVIAPEPNGWYDLEDAKKKVIDREKERHLGDCAIRHRDWDKRSGLESFGYNCAISMADLNSNGDYDMVYAYLNDLWDVYMRITNIISRS